MFCFSGDIRDTINVSVAEMHTNSIISNNVACIHNCYKVHYRLMGIEQRQKNGRVI